tara:strand:+ start:2470 stop:4176 length:1707 start_codon:yes stop_codon:yes gene_type:complete
MKKKLGVYCRVSSSNQKEKGGSIEFQNDKGSKYCIKNGYDFEVIEEVESGDKVNREKLEEMFNRIYNDELDGFWIYDWNRLIRDKKVGVYFERMLEDKPKTIIIQNDIIVDIKNNYGDRMNYELNGFVSNIFLYNLKKNVKDGSVKKLKDGKVLRKMKMGYSKVKGDVIINDESKIIKEIFRVFLFKNIKSYNDLTLYINKKFDKKYNNSMIMKWLKYEGYNGEINQKYLDFKIKTKVPKIIDDITFKSVSDKIKTIYSKRKGRDSSDYLCKGLVYCGSCGEKMYKYGSVNRLHYKKNKDGSIGDNYKKERKYVRDFHYYKCSQSDYKKVNETLLEYDDRMKGCGSFKRNSINLNMLDRVIWEGLFRYLNQSDKLKKEFGKKSKDEVSKMGKNSGKKKYYKLEIEKLKEIKKETYKDWKNGKIDENDFNQFNSDFNNEIINNESRLNEIENHKILNIDDNVIDDYLEVMKLSLKNKEELGDNFFNIKRLEFESDVVFYKRKNGSMKDMKKEIEKYIRKIYVKRVNDSEYYINFEFNMKLFDSEKKILENNLINNNKNLLYINSTKVCY